DSENPKKPAELYAKVRDVAPASSVACQFASLFDIQTGELLIPHPPYTQAVPSSHPDTSQASDGIPLTTGRSESSDVMPWEQFDGAPATLETPLSTSSNSILESHDVSETLMDSAPVGLVQEVPEILPPESTEPIHEANPIDQDMLSSILAEPLV